MPVDYSKYPADWKAIRARILKRAENRCEVCGIPNYERGSRDDTDKWWSVAEQIDYFNDFGCLPGDMESDTHPIIRIVLTVSHQNHDINDNSDGNLMALCQRCHLRHDADHHAENARITRERKRGQCLMEL